MSEALVVPESDEIIEQVEYFAKCMSCENRISVWQEKTDKGNLEADDIIESEGWWYIDGAWLCPVCQAVSWSYLSDNQD